MCWKSQTRMSGCVFLDRGTLREFTREYTQRFDIALVQ